MSMVNLGHSGHLSIFTLLKHLMMLLKYNFFQGFIFTPYQWHWYHLGLCSSDFFLSESLLNNAFKAKHKNGSLEEIYVIELQAFQFDK